MTGNRRPQLPGSHLLSCARLLFSGEVVQSLFEPAVADLQHEWQQAAPRKWRRRLALLRAYGACARLFLVAPFAAPPAAAPAGNAGPPTAFDAPDDGTLGKVLLMWLLLLAAMWSLVGRFVLVLAIGTLATAAAMHKWQCRHAGANGSRYAPLPGRPEINFAAIPVYGNMAGLLVVVGSLAVIAAGLPVLGLFLLIAAVSGAGVAVALRAWHVAHPASWSNSIAGR